MQQRLLQTSQALQMMVLLKCLGDSWMQVKVPYACWNKKQSFSVQEDLLEHIHIRFYVLTFLLWEVILWFQMLHHSSSD